MTSYGHTFHKSNIECPYGVGTISLSNSETSWRVFWLSLRVSYALNALRPLHCASPETPDKVPCVDCEPEPLPWMQAAGGSRGAG